MMSTMSKREYLIQLRKKYWRAGKLQKTQLLNDCCDFTGYHRKAALRVIHRPLPAKWKRPRPREKYYDQLVVDAVIKLWRAANEICAERLQPFIPALASKLVDCGGLTVDLVTYWKLLEISLITVKRIIGKAKRRSTIKLGGTTKPGSLLKSHIAIRCGPWTEDEPGWCETDTVDHSGGDISGEFIYSLDLVDICTGWSEQAAIWGKGELATKEQIDAIRKRLPFQLKGLDPDNGSEFINWQLHRYCQKNNITLTRCRPYHKNDQAHVEQKNYTAIRQLVGWSRLDRREQLTILNDLYSRKWRLYLNFFQPTMKLKEKIKDTQTGKVKKHYYEAKTPYQRLMGHTKIDTQTKAMLQSIYQSLNPLQLQKEIKHQLELLKRSLK